MLEGYVHPSFRDVAELFERQLPTTVPGGGALTVRHRGEVVVDLWGGQRAPGECWQQDTVATSFSTSKGVASTLVHLLADRGLVDYRTPVAHYWPEFAQADKGRISVRTLLAHEAGLYDVRDLLPSADVLTDWDKMLELLAAARPAHRPGSRHGYHAWTYGFLVGGLVERVTGKRLAEVLDEELVQPLGLDGAYFGLPEQEHGRAATLVLPKAREGEPSNGPWIPGLGVAKQVTNAAVRSQTKELRRALVPHGIRDFDLNGAAFRSSCNPSAGGMFTARSLAGIYGMLAEGGLVDGHRYLSSHTLAKMGKRQSSTPDLVLRMPMHWRLGYHRIFSLTPRAPQAFGHFGWGGSGAWADPSRRLSLGFTCNSGTGSPVGDLRIMRLTTATLRAADAR
ncbi:MAG TPA: serine hydrolase domain-containing protein [Nocardioidaceae bacterium]|nr:serine hydrolase domain-containing protein [Nocardioidaceae bacterium]